MNRSVARPTNRRVPPIWTALVAGGALAACSGPPGSAVVRTTGCIGIALTAATGVTLNAVTYTISNTC